MEKTDSYIQMIEKVISFYENDLEKYKLQRDKIILEQGEDQYLNGLKGREFVIESHKKQLTI